MIDSPAPNSSTTVGRIGKKASSSTFFEQFPLLSHLIPHFEIGGSRHPDIAHMGRVVTFCEHGPTPVEVVRL